MAKARGEAKGKKARYCIRLPQKVMLSLKVPRRRFQSKDDAMAFYVKWIGGLWEDLHKVAAVGRCR